MKRWDVFISHASEDKQSVALPLAESLIRSGLRVWLDRFELKIGDSLREKIDEGLAESAFGVVVLSEHFLNKGWPKRELNGLFAVEEDGAKVILPVWHGIDKTTLTRYSPILADRLAANTEEGLPAVARAVAQVVLDGLRERSEHISLSRRFAEILDRGPSAMSVSSFLTTFPRVLVAALGHSGNDHRGHTYRISPNFEKISPDLVAGSYWLSSRTWSWTHFFFCPADGSLLEPPDSTGPLKPAVDTMRHLLSWLDGHPQKAASVLLSDEEYDPFIVKKGQDGHRGVILVGRRDGLSENVRDEIRALRGRGVEIRSYDWLLEACAVAEGRNA